jgi:outer membrane protein assembly factor BamB
MRSLWFFLIAALIVATAWAADWPMPGGNPQRNGWAGSERQLNKANVSGLKLLYKYQTDNQSKGLNSLTAPIINGNLITYRGFKEMLMFGGSSDKVFSVDADLNKPLWESHLPYRASTPPRKSSTLVCPSGLTAPVVMAGSSSSSLHFAARASRTPAGPGVARTRPSPYVPSLAQSIYPLLPTTLTQLNALYAVSSDGYLHVLNSSTGEDLLPSVRFVPPNAKVTSLNLRDNVVYATTSDNCDGYQNALFAIDLLSPGKTVTSFVVQGGFSGSAGTAIGNDGAVYVQTAYAPADRPNRYYDAVVALTPKELKLKNYWLLGDKPVDPEKQPPGITPTVFSLMGRDVVIAGGSNGRLYLLDSNSPASGDHRTSLFVSTPLIRNSKSYDGSGFRGVFSSWWDVDTDARWFYVPVFGRLRPPAELKNVADDSGAFIAAAKLTGTSEQPVLQPVWISRKMVSPAPVVIANGMAFVLSTGQFEQLRKKHGEFYTTSEFQQLAKPAALFVFDATTGKELYSSGDAVSGAASPAGLAFANSRAYFTDQNNAVYCFGIPSQHKQLSSR